MVDWVGRDLDFLLNPLIFLAKYTLMIFFNFLYYHMQPFVPITFIKNHYSIMYILEQCFDVKIPKNTF